MINKVSYILIMLLCLTTAKGQNLVPNHSFEDYISCPTVPGQISLAIPWAMPYNTGLATSDFYNACNTGNVSVPSNPSGYQNAHTGKGYAGIWIYGLNMREYLQIQLTSPLIAGNTYYAEMYVSPSEYCVAADAIGIHISTNAISGSGDYFPLPYLPQISNPTNSIISDTMNWTLVSGYYTALGGENYITIGNFLDDANTNYLDIDSAANNRAYYWIDDVTIYNTSGINKNEISSTLTFYPNPFTNQTTLYLGSVCLGANLIVVNSFGQIVKQKTNISTKTVTILRKNLPSGLYYVRLIKDHKIIKTGTMIIIDN
ncbi:MAG: T9SS type A sorting domain-containing protein [Bacteroidota bacterium]